MGKIRFLNMQSVSPKALLAQIAEDENLDGIVVCVRRKHVWSTAWSSGLDSGSLCMAAMVLQHNVTDRIFTPDEEDVEYGEGDDPA